MHKDDLPLSVGGCFLYEVGKFFFMPDFAQSKQACQLLSGFHYWPKLAIFPMLITILYSPAMDLDGTSASWNMLALCERTCFDKVFLMA